MSVYPDVASIFPPTARCCVSLTPPPSPELHSAEQEHTARMAPGRLLQFAHGRACARRALAALGIEPCAILVGPQREPLWPAGIMGSISHCEHRAAAAVGRESDFVGIGVDLEEPGPLPGDIRDLVCTPREAAHLEQLPVSYGRLLFSAKESVFKCVFPIVRRFVDFHEITVTLQISGQRFQAYSDDAALGPLTAQLDGRFALIQDAWLTSAWVERELG